MPTINLLLLIIVVAVVAGALPVYSYNRHWGYGPSGMGLVLAIIVLWLLFGRG